MNQYIKNTIDSKTVEDYALPSWIINCFKHWNLQQDVNIYTDSEDVYLHHKLTSSREVRLAFLVYQVELEDKNQKSNTYARGILERIWGFRFQTIDHPTQNKIVYFCCFSLYEIYGSLGNDIAKSVYSTDVFLEKLISEGPKATDNQQPKIVNMYRLSHIKSTLLPEKQCSFLEIVPFEKSVAKQLGDINFVHAKTAMKGYIERNPNLFLKNINDAYLTYKIDDFPPILALEKIVSRDMFLKEILVFRHGCCYLWKLNMLSTLKLESRAEYEDQHLDVQYLSTLSLTKIYWYLKTFYNLDITIDLIHSTLVDIALENSEKPKMLSQVGEDKIEKSSQVLTIFFSMPLGIIEIFQEGLESSSLEGGVNFRAAQKFLVQFGQLNFLRDDFKMACLLKSYEFKLNGDTIRIIQKSKKWLFTKNGKVCNFNPFQGGDTLANFDDVEFFSKSVLKSIENTKGKDKC